jgi:outer membrane lipoprotein LolB
MAAQMVAIALAGCATSPRLPTDADAGTDALSGRLTVQIASDPPQRLSASFELGGDAVRGQLALSGPVGVQLARASWQPGEAILETADGRWRKPDMTALAVAALGEAIPVPALFDWLRGRPWPGADSRPLAQAADGFEQLGWRIDLKQFAKGQIVARRDEPPVVTLRVVLEPRS